MSGAHGQSVGLLAATQYAVQRSRAERTWTVNLAEPFIDLRSVAGIIQLPCHPQQRQSKIPPGMKPFVLITRSSAQPARLIFLWPPENCLPSFLVIQNRLFLASN